MQPGTLVIVLIIMPLFTVNGVYLMSAIEGLIPWCVPYIDGCTTVSRAARSGNAIFLFRVTMIVYALLLICFWIYAERWLNMQQASSKISTKVMTWMGVIGALAMMVYVDFLGTEGEVNRFMRRYGIMLFFIFTPLAQFLLYREHRRFQATATTGIEGALRLQFIVLLLMLVIAFSSLFIDLVGKQTYEVQNIVEWNFSLLMNLYFIGMLRLWRDFRISFSC